MSQSAPRLLVDLLEHEGLVAALLRSLLVPVDLLRRAGGELEVAVPDGVGAGLDRDDLVVLDQHDLARLAQERRDGRGHEALAVADAEHQRALAARGHQAARLVHVRDDEGEVAAEARQHLADGRRQVAPVLAGDQVRDDLGVGVGVEDDAQVLQLGAQLQVVLDDPVHHHEHRAVGAGVRVGVLGGHAAVRGPARVPEPGGRRRGGVRAGDVAQLREVADGAHRLDQPVVLREEGEAGGVVPAVLEALEAGEDQLTARPASDVSDDPAHAALPPG